ncbi:MAG: zinc ABC transporter substrate-binding protein [Rhodothermales bacterium]
MMRHSLRLVVLLLIAASGAMPAWAQGKLNVVTTLPDFRYIAEYIGGDQVDAFAIATGYQDPHFVDPKPSYILKLSRADVFVTAGLDLELGWVPPLLNSARNDKVLKGGPGYVDASENIALLNVPSSVSREQGDIHIYGNPHYWVDPLNGKIVARNIYNALVRLRPAREAYFAANLAKFEQEIDRRMTDWMARMAPYAGTKIMAYHDQWPYFEKRFGLEIVDFLEPKPGIPPTPSQLAKIITTMQSQHIRVIIIPPYFKQDSASLVARKTGGEVVTLASSVEAFKEVKTYFDLFDYNIDKLVAAFSAAPH